MHLPLFCSITPYSLLLCRKSQNTVLCCTSDYTAVNLFTASLLCLLLLIMFLESCFCSCSSITQHSFYHFFQKLINFSFDLDALWYRTWAFTTERSKRIEVCIHDFMYFVWNEWFNNIWSDLSTPILCLL